MAKRRREIAPIRAVRYLIHRATLLVRPTPHREQLHYLLASANPKASLQERVVWLEQLMIWIRTASVHQHSFDPETGQLHNARLRFFLHLLRRNPEWRDNVSKTLRTSLEETSALVLFSQVGLGQHRGFVAEATDRVFKNTLPRPAQDQELSDLFLRIFKDPTDAVWVSHIPASLIDQLCELISTEEEMGQPTLKHWEDDIKDALLILGARIGSLGTLPEVLNRLPSGRVQNLPFLRLSHQLAAVIQKSNEHPPTLEEVEHLLAECEECQKGVELVLSSLEKSGVSVSLVYVLENISDTTRRAEMLLRFLVPTETNRPLLIINFLAMLVKDRLSQKTLTDLIKNNLHLISRKIVERAGASGEHYITRTLSEYYQMLRAGLGGGAVMVIATLMKFFIGSLSLPLFFEGVFFSINYATCFVTLQLLGFTLATKQPSAVASSLAGKLADWEEDGEVRDFVNEVCRMTRTQFAALVGNLAMVIPVTILIDVGSYYLLGQHVLPVAKAKYVFDSVNPIKSFSVINAAFTGVLLWISSLAAGWFENWVVFHRIPEGVASQRRLIYVFGKPRAHRMGQWILKNATALGGNISLGILMVLPGMFGHFTGLPIDTRHVTLATASLSLAVSTLFSREFEISTLALPALGILLIGFMNFAVSYSLSLFVATRARNVKLGNLQRLLRAVRSRLRVHPLEFFYPAKGRPSVQMPSDITHSSTH